MSKNIINAVLMPNILGFVLTNIGSSTRRKKTRDVIAAHKNADNLIVVMNSTGGGEYAIYQRFYANAVANIDVEPIKPCTDVQQTQ